MYMYLNFIIIKAFFYIVCLGGSTCIGVFMLKCGTVTEWGPWKGEIRGWGLAVFVHGPARKAIKKALIDSEVRYLNISLSHPTPKQGSLN